MDAEELRKTYREIANERADLSNHRIDLETELSDTRKKIAHFDEVLNHLAPMLGMAHRDGGVAGLGITEAIRYVIRRNGERFAPTDVRERLQEAGYDLSDLTAPMASVYKILARLADNPSEQVEREKEEGRVYYRFTGISDDDIPF
jgi:hypothetical protein